MAAHRQPRHNFFACPCSLPWLPSSPSLLLCCAAALLLNTGFAAAQTETGNISLEQLSSSIRHLTRRAAPSVVEIMVTGYGAGDPEHGGVSNQISVQRSSGSGVIVDPAGYIMTNAHVVQGALKLKVLLANREIPKVIGSNLSDGMVVKEARDSGNGLRLRSGIDPGRSGQPPGSRVWRFRPSASRGLGVRARQPGRFAQFAFHGSSQCAARAVNDENPIQYIQTDAPINPGNSGGALVNTKGSLIGMNAYILSQSGGNEGIGFAIPSNIVRDVYRQLRNNGRVSRGTVGLFLQNITVPMAEGLDFRRLTELSSRMWIREGPATRRV